MNKFDEEYKGIMNYNILQEKKFTAKDIPLLQKEEKETISLLKAIDKAVNGLYTAQKELEYLGRTVKGLPATKAKHTKALGGFSTTSVKLYEKLTDYQTKLNDYILDLQELQIDLEPEN